MTDPSHKPGEPPEVHDEAPDSPLWLPAIGLGLLLLAVLLVLVPRGAEGDLPEEPGDAAAAEEGAAPEDGANAEGDAPAPADAPAAAAPAPAAAAPTPAGGADAFGRPPGAEHYGHEHGTDQDTPAAGAAPAAPAPTGPDAYGRQPGDEHHGHDHE